jgi:hypothetical protein
VALPRGGNMLKMAALEHNVSVTAMELWEWIRHIDIL